MFRSNLMRVLLIIGSVLIMTGVALNGWIRATEDERNVINVQIDENKTQSVEFQNLRLVPGEQCEYKILLSKAGTKTYDLKLNFVEKEVVEVKELKNYVRVKILADGQEVCDEILATLFENDEIILPIESSKEKRTELTIVYYLPIEVGNEAKNAHASFELLLTASNE